MNQGDLYRWGRRVLADHGIDTASFDAMTLLCRCLQKDRQQILVHGEDLALPEAETKYRAQIAKRAAREPLQYLLGDWEFLDMTLQVGPGVLVPREETELLCRQAAALLQPGGVGLDLCAGTGAVALGLQRLCPQKTVWAVEKYEQAFSFLCRNIQKWVPDHVKAVKADVLQGPIEGVWLYPVDFLLSNPPYVTPKAYEGLQEEFAFIQGKILEMLDKIRGASDYDLEFEDDYTCRKTECSQLGVPVLITYLCHQPD